MEDNRENEGPIITLLRGCLARGYCHKENEKKILDPDLIEAMIQELVESSIQFTI